MENGWLSTFILNDKNKKSACWPFFTAPAQVNVFTLMCI
jgi:hypothetical protein